MTIVVPSTSEHWQAARRLVEDYAASLGIDLAFQDFDREIDSLGVEYGPPHGAFVLAEHDGAFVGCGGFRRLSAPGTQHPAPSTQHPFVCCEMKRLYVDPRGRGHGLGRLLAVRLIEEARALGYAGMRLDTLPTMRAARQLYAELGFREIPAYRYNPVEGTTFMELAL